MLPQLMQNTFPVQGIAPHALRQQGGEGPVDLSAGSPQRIHLICHNGIVIQHHARTKFHDHVSGAVRQRAQNLSPKRKYAWTGHALPLRNDLALHGFLDPVKLLL